jgi:hypothetical protein
VQEVQRTLLPLLSRATADSTKIMEVFDFKQLQSFVALGVPSCAMMCSEWW